MPQICVQSMTGLLKPEANAAKVLGRALEIEDLALEGQPPSPIVYRQLLGKCGHGEAWPRDARGGAHQLYSTQEYLSAVFSLVGWLVFKGEENEENKL